MSDATNDRTTTEPPLEQRLTADVEHGREQVALLEREYNELLADPGVIQEDRDTARVLLEQAREMYHAAERSLRRLHEGEYGRCERCGQEIAPERLEALPDTRRCVTCAAK